MLLIPSSPPTPFHPMVSMDALRTTQVNAVLLLSPKQEEEPFILFAKAEKKWSLIGSPNSNKYIPFHILPLLHIFSPLPPFPFPFPSPFPFPFPFPSPFPLPRCNKCLLLSLKKLTPVFEDLTPPNSPLLKNCLKNQFILLFKR